jgi:hypothetical protein
MGRVRNGFEHWVVTVTAMAVKYPQGDCADRPSNFKGYQRMLASGVI